MFWLRRLSDFVSALFRKNGYREKAVKVDKPAGELAPAPEQAKRDKDAAVFREKDFPLSEHFGLFELTTTSATEMQEANRTLSDSQVERLEALAEHAENIRKICGGAVIIHSGYRAGKLNGTITGSSATSQHPRCEAIDFHVKDQSVGDTFNKLLTAAREQNFKFGQLIIEKAERSYGTTQWIHCSVVGTLDATKVGQVMKMVAGIDGISHYVLIDRLKFSE